MKKKATVWWGTFPFEIQTPRYWEIGPLKLSIERDYHEWRILDYSCDNQDKNKVIAGTLDPIKFPTDDIQLKRFICSQTQNNVVITPVLADRSQVSFAETPFYLSPHESATIYVSSPLWVRIETGNPHHVLIEIPTMRQSDTWHGPNTQEGELCYASRTFCRTQLDEILSRSYRVISPVTVHNNAKHELMIEQLSLPLPYLSIYADINGNLWTEEVILKNDPHHRHSVKQGKGAPHIAPEAALLTPSRQPLKTANLLSMFYGLLVE